MSRLGLGGVCKRGFVVLAGAAVLVSGLSTPALAGTATVGARPTVAAGLHHSLVVTYDGTLWAWGRNGSGQLGDGTRTKRTTPVKVLTDVVTVAAGHNFSLALKTDGSLWAWGTNYYGQLGDGTVTRRTKPIRVMNDVKAIAAGGEHSLAVKNDGSLWAWGGNWAGQLGDNTTGYKKRPVWVMNGVASVAGGGEHSLAVTTGGDVYSWGANWAGQLGVNDYKNRRAPAYVTSGVSVVAAGWAHNLAIKTNGTLWAWGCMDNAATGIPSHDDLLWPVQVMSGSFTTIAAGLIHSFAVRSDGALYGWGWNSSGQLGDGTRYTQWEPKYLGSNVRTVAGGGSHSLIVGTDGLLLSVGNNSYGQLGDATTSAKRSPVIVKQTGPGAVTMVRMLPTTLYLVAGKSATLEIAVHPYGALLQEVTFKSANTAVAKVDGGGRVTAKKAAGKSTTITVRSVDGKFSAKCKVYVVAKAAALKSIKVPSSLTTGVGVGQKIQIKPGSSPAKATGVVPQFMIDNWAVAEIDAAGVITGKSPGKATVTVWSGSRANTFVVTVGAVAPTAIAINKTKATVSRGKQVELWVTSWVPVNSDPKTVIWKTSNSKIATVDSDGLVTAKKKGKVTISAVTWNGKKVTCVVTVK